jgi:hypothetical protein
MGLDMSYQAIPAECDLIDRARDDQVAGELLCRVPHWFRKGQGPKPGTWPEGEQFWNHLCELAIQFPGLEQWNFDLHRSWDELHYLLSATRRGAKGAEEDKFLDNAVRGTGEIADHVRAPQGGPVRYVTPSEVELIAVVLDPLNNESLRIHYSPKKMELRKVYKFWADRAGEFEFSAVRYFDGFRAFYLEAASRGNGVIVCLD